MLNHCANLSLQGFAQPIRSQKTFHLMERLYAFSWRVAPRSDSPHEPNSSWGRKVQWRSGSLPLYGIICACLWAYTRGVQEATLFWGKQLGKGNELLPATGMQDAITPPGQNTRNIIAILSVFALPILGAYYLGWIVGLVGFVSSFIARSIIRLFCLS
jgi:hypothetical protein